MQLSLHSAYHFFKYTISQHFSGIAYTFFRYNNISILYSNFKKKAHTNCKKITPDNIAKYKIIIIVARDLCYFLYSQSFILYNLK